MSNRVYLLIALAFVIGGPLVVTIISDVLPAPRGAESSPITPTEVSRPTPPPVEKPQPPVVAIQQPIGSTDPLFNAEPSMNARGLDIPVLAEPAAARAQEPTNEDDGPLDPPLLPPDIPASQHR